MKRILIALALAIISSGCSEPNPKSGKSVAILKLGAHELIDQVEIATVNGLRQKYGDEVKVSLYNGNFQPDTIRLAVTQISHSNFDLAIPITTSATTELVNAINIEPNVVFSFVSNPEEVWGKGNDRPGFVTGTSDKLDYRKNVNLIKQLFPDARTIGYLVNESEANARDGLKQMRDLAPESGFDLVVAGVSSSGEVTLAARSIVSNVDVFLVGGDNTVVGGLGGLLSVADDKNIPVFAVENSSVKEGALAAYGVDYEELGKATSALAIKVLEGASPSSLDVVYFSKTKLFVNDAMASKFGLDFSSYEGIELY